MAGELNEESLRQLARLMEEEQRRSLAAQSKFAQSIGRANTDFSALHGSTDAARHSLLDFTKSLGPTAAAFTGVIGGVIDSLTSMYGTYNKLAGVGINFNGSMLEMQKQAGTAGLSLDEFARSVQRNSTIIAQMGASQSGSVAAFAQFQRGIRDSTKQFGYYGMTISQINDASGDYADTLRQTGQWEQMSDLQRRNATADYIKNVAGMAAATGKSREEIIKLSNQALRAPATAAALSQLGPQQAEAAQSFTTQMAATMDDAGQLVSSMLSQTIAAQGQTWATDLGKVNIAAGMSGLNEEFEAMYRKIQSGQAATEEDFDRIAKMREQIGAHRGSLLSLRLDPANQAGVDQLLKFFNDTAGYHPDIAFQRYKEAQTKQMDLMTQAAASFQSNFQQITGDFRTGFYEGLIALMPGNNDKEKLAAFERTLADLGQSMRGFGQILGGALGILTQAIPLVELGFEGAISALKLFETVVKTLLTPLNWLLNLVYQITGRGDAPDIAKPIAAFMTIALGLVGILKARNFVRDLLKVEARTVILNGGGGNLGDLVGGGGAPAGGGPPGRPGFLSRAAATARRAPAAAWNFLTTPGSLMGAVRAAPGAAVSGVRGLATAGAGMAASAGSGMAGFMRGGMGAILKGIVRFGPMALKGIAGALVSLLVDPFLNLFGDFRGKKTISRAAEYAGYGATIGTLFFGVGALPGALIGALIGVIVENFDSIMDGIGWMISGAWDGVKWVGRLVGGILAWIGSKVDAFVPGWLKKLIGPTNVPATADAAATVPQVAPGQPIAANDNAVSMFQNQIAGQLHSFLPTDPYDAMQSRNSDDLIKAMGFMMGNPEKLKSAIELVQKPDTPRTFLTGDVKESDKFDDLASRLINLDALKTVDQRRADQGDSSKTQELIDINQKTQDIIAALLRRGIAQQESAANQAQHQSYYDTNYRR